MASKAELVAQAQALGIIVEDGDTAKILTEKIIQAQNAITEKANSDKARETVLPEEAKQLNSNLKRIKVTPEQLKKLQADGKLVGWDPQKGEALIL